MSIVRITEDDIERYTLLASPKVYYASSTFGITGSLPLFADGSAKMKDVYPGANLYVPVSSASNDADIESVRSQTKLSVSGNVGGYAGTLAYINAVHSVTSSSKFSKSQNILRFEPSVRLDPNFFRKKIVRELLFPYYRHKYPTSQWNYSNYHTLNFVTGGNLPTDSVIIYPAGTASVALENQNPLAPSSSFTFDFYLNPRYTTQTPQESYTAGTIFHMSSCYAISVVTGSNRGPDGKPSGFRLLLQLSQSAEIPPSSVRISGNSLSAPGSSVDPGFLFISNDNSLSLNNWHHVGVRWGGPNVNSGVGSFVIDGIEQGSFTITSQSCMQSSVTGDAFLGDPDALFIGNFYEGTNRGSSTVAQFFNINAAANEGCTSFGADYINSDPTFYEFRHPLNAEVHDLKIFQTYRNDQQLLTSSIYGYSFLTGSTSLTGSQDLVFYVPPFFTKETLPHSVLQTPFQALDNTVTDDPFNVALSFGVGGHLLNLENFVKEFVRGTRPRLLNLFPYEITTNSPIPQTANYYLYESGTNRKRNITVLPCDNGRFTPNFEMLLTNGLTNATFNTPLDRFIDDFGGTDLSIIKLTDMVSTSSLLKATDPNDNFTANTGSLLAPLVTSVAFDSKIDPGVGGSQILTILQRTGDPSSNEIVFFDISNMFYGDRIKPGSVILTDLAVTGTAGRVSVTLKDDGYGNLFRADANTPPARWASVGNVMYEEGIVIVKSPNLPLFGADSWEMSFQGERNIHVYEVNVPAPKSLINSSTNPTFQPMLPTDYHSETANSFVYITGIQLHDDNLNVIGRANLAQPVVKRDGDRIVFRLRMDY